MEQGIIIKSTPLLDNTVFEKTIIYIAEYNDQGALGFIINQPFPRTLNELEEFKHIKPFPLHTGGPVDQEHLYFIHQRPDLISDGVLITGNTFLGGDFKSAVQQIDKNILMGGDIKIFIGYCGWDGKELEDEIAEGSWEIAAEGTLF